MACENIILTNKFVAFRDGSDHLILRRVAPDAIESGAFSDKNEIEFNC